MDALDPPEVGTMTAVALDGARVGPDVVGAREGDADGAWEGAYDGAVDGSAVGDADGARDGDLEGACDGCADGVLDGAQEGAALGEVVGSVGASDGRSVGDSVVHAPSCHAHASFAHAAMHGLGARCWNGLHPGAQSSAWRHVCACASAEEHGIIASGAPRHMTANELAGFAPELNGLQNVCVAASGLVAATHSITVAHRLVLVSTRDAVAPTSTKNAVTLNLDGTPSSSAFNPNTPVCMRVPRARHSAGFAATQIVPVVSLMLYRSL